MRTGSGALAGLGLLDFGDGLCVTSTSSLSVSSSASSFSLVGVGLFGLRHVDAHV
jgi:hypothetical protein